MIKSNDVTTIQLTSKNLKLQILISKIVFICSLLYTISNASDPLMKSETVIGCIFVLLSFVRLGVIRFQIWWHHK